MKKYLVLENGSVFEGKGFGADCDTIGELVFNTGVVGYIETLCDPCNYGQIVLQTYPQIGNYGMISEDVTRDPSLFGYVVREFCDEPSNFRCDGRLDVFLREKGIPGICGVDTREITRILRDEGAMNAAICSEIPENFDVIKAYRIKGGVEKLAAKQRSVYPAENEKRFEIALVDFGAADAMLPLLTAHRCDEVTVLAPDCSADELMGYDGIVLSDGPGDPSDNMLAIFTFGQIIGQKPIFGVGLGHQILALAMGGQTYKLSYGHRGANQPVRDLNGNRTYITSQNHGYAVAPGVPGAKVLYTNANDATVEGLEYPMHNAFSVQFKVTSSDVAPAHNHEAGELMARFHAMMGGNN